MIRKNRKKMKRTPSKTIGRRKMTRTPTKTKMIGRRKIRIKEKLSQIRIKSLLNHGPKTQEKREKRNSQAKQNKKGIRLQLIPKITKS